MRYREFTYPKQFEVVENKGLGITHNGARSRIRTRDSRRNYLDRNYETLLVEQTEMCSQNQKFLVKKVLIFKEKGGVYFRNRDFEFEEGPVRVRLQMLSPETVAKFVRPIPPRADLSGDNVASPAKLRFLKNNQDSLNGLTSKGDMEMGKDFEDVDESESGNAENCQNVQSDTDSYDPDVLQIMVEGENEFDF